MVNLSTHQLPCEQLLPTVCVCVWAGVGGSTHNALEMILFQGSSKLHDINVSFLSVASAFSSITGMNKCLGKTTPEMVLHQKLDMALSSHPGPFQQASSLICSNLH